MTLSAKAASVVAAWTLDEASGVRADQVGANDLADTGTVGSAAGMFGNAADFEASSNDILTIADNADLSGADVDLMIRCWIKIESLASTGAILCKCDTVTATVDYALYVDTSGNLNWRVADTGGLGFTNAVWSGTLSTATWYLVHAWHDATGNLIGIAVNAGTAVTQATSSGVRNTAEAFALGGEPGGTRYYDGLIDDALVMKGAFLDAAERTEDYNAGTGVAFADWAGGGGVTVPALDQGMLTGGLANLTGGIA